MYQAFLIVTLVGFLYFLIKKRRFDFFSLAFFSAVVYFMPGLLGYVMEPKPSRSRYVGWVNRPVPILDETYAVMMAVLIGILLGVIVYDLFIDKDRPFTINIPGIEYTYLVATTIAVVGFIVAIIRLGPALGSGDKAELLARFGHVYIFWSYGALIGMVLSYLRKKWLPFAVCMLLLFLTYYLTFIRYYFIIGLMIIFIIHLYNQGPQRLIRKWKYMALAIFFGYFSFIIHSLKIPLKTGNWDFIAHNNVFGLKYTLAIIGSSEPFWVQAQLNKVIKENFHVGLEHLTSIIYSPLFFTKELGIKVYQFNEFYQPKFYPFVDAGMANNIWAECWSAGDWPFLLFFIGIYATVLIIGCLLMQVRNPTLYGSVLIFFCFWAFYIHRNSFLTQIPFHKRVFLFMLIFFAGSVLYKAIFTKKERGQQAVTS